LKKKVCVLLTSSGAPYTSGIIDFLKNNYEKRKIRIVCTDVKDQALMHYKADQFHLIPHGKSKNFIKKMIEVCKKEKVDVVIPRSAWELLSLSKNLELLNSKGISVAVSDVKTIQQTIDKYHVYKILKENKIPVPNFVLIQNQKEFVKALKKLGYPKKTICFKPSKQYSSGGSRGFRILRNTNSIGDIILTQKKDSAEIDYETAKKVFSKKTIEMLIMEYVSGIHYSVHVFADHGKMLYCVPLEVKRPSHAYFGEGVITRNQKLTKISQKLVELFNFHSNVNFQFIISKNNIPKLIEINPRMSASINLPSYGGINMPYLAVKQAIGEGLPKLKINYGRKMIRYQTQLFIK